MSSIEVEIAVAVSESGRIRSIPINRNSVQSVQEYRAFELNLKQDHELWAVKIIRTNVNWPYQFEDQT